MNEKMNTMKRARTSSSAMRNKTKHTRHNNHRRGHGRRGRNINMISSPTYNPRHIILFFLQILNTVKIFHWMTYKYPEHKASDDLYDALSEKMDRFVEVMLGKKIEIPRFSIISSIPVDNAENMKVHICDYIETLNVIIPSTTENSDLINIKEEMVAELNKFLYLLSLS